MKKTEITVTESLAVRHRPKTLKDVVGQPGAVTQLEGMIKRRQFPSSFLITGNSGVGKTTVARLIARYVNCETLTACGECPSCLLGDAHPDFMDENMASTRGIDDIRGLAEAAKRLPRFNKRVYLLDECHMLTQQASNALLKTLEEPPGSTIWILATTDPEKLLKTIIGRCTRFDLRPVDEADIVPRLYKIGRREGVDFKKIEQGTDMLKHIASMCNGQMRDAIQMLESLINVHASGTPLDFKELLKIVLTDGEKDADKLAVSVLTALLRKDMKRMFHFALGTPAPRTLLHKLRWIIHSHIQHTVSRGKFMSYGYRLFATQVEKLKLPMDDDALLLLTRLQQNLVEAELKMNAGINEEVALLNALGAML